jgi:hypothetical protein
MNDKNHKNSDPGNFVERRSKWRFLLQREVRYKVLENEQIGTTGGGFTTDISSAGVAFVADRELPSGAFIELSISWPVLLDDFCPIRLIIFGRVVRSRVGLAACTVEKYEFRTQPRNWHEKPVAARNDTMLQRWVESLRKDCLRTTARAAAAHA